MPEVDELDELASLFFCETYIQGDDQLIIDKLKDWTKKHNLTYNEVFLKVEERKKQVLQYICMYAFFLEHGFGTLKNKEHAIQHYKIVAEQDSFALNQLGYNTDDAVEAFSYYLKAAKKGHPQGMSNVANSYLCGRQLDSFNIFGKFTKVFNIL